MVIQHAQQQVIEKLIGNISSLIENTKRAITRSVNTKFVLLYWSIGKQINEEILKGTKGSYGEFIVIEVSKQLASRYGEGFSKANVFRMLQFAKCFPNEKEVNKLTQLHLKWSHFVALIALDSPLQRKFYTEMCRIEFWSVRDLRKKIKGMLYERVGLSKKPEDLIEDELKSLQEKDQLTPDLVFQDPYLLDFLGLKDKYSEFDLESNIIHELESFILELGTDFCFIARQKRISIGGKDYYLDLLFLHRRLNRLIAIELKLGDFMPSYKGQMELYLRWLDKNERRPHEKKPLGIILCSKKETELVELLELNQTGIHVAEYLTELPPMKELEDRFHRAIVKAKEKATSHQLLLSDKEEVES